VASPQLPIQSRRSATIRGHQPAGAATAKGEEGASGFSAEGGELIAYFDSKAIVKMLATYYGETGRTVEEFYCGMGS